MYQVRGTVTIAATKPKADLTDGFGTKQNTMIMVAWPLCASLTETNLGNCGKKGSVGDNHCSKRRNHVY